MKNPDRRNKYFFGLGTIGRDMFYAFEANALLYFLSNILSLPIHVFAAVSLVLSVLRIADALNDPITGLVIDNIHTKWGKFKPAILVGGVVSVIFYLILFGNVGTGTAYVIFFAAAYVLWDISYGINDIAYWTLLPALTQDQKQRENYGAFARICANIGMYIIMVGWQPITAALGNTPKAWMTVAVSVSVIYLAGLCFPLFGVKENREIKEDDEKFTIRDMWNAITKKRSAHVDDALHGAVYGRILHDDRLCDVLYAVSLRRYQYVRHSGRRLRRGTAGGTDDLPAVFQKI